MDFTYLFLFLTFVLTVLVIYMTVLMVRKFKVTFSPRELASFGLVMFSMGWVIESYLLGSALGTLEGASVSLLLTLYYGNRWWKRRKLHIEKQEAGVP